MPGTILVNRVMIFGVFDGLHDGHRFFIKEAQKYGNTLFIVVTPDDTVKFMKGTRPVYHLMERIGAIEKEYGNKVEVITGDNRSGLWTQIKKFNPDIIVIGYDQKQLYSALKGIQDGYDFELVQIKKNFKGNKLHSSLINKKDD